MLFQFLSQVSGVDTTPPLLHPRRHNQFLLSCLAFSSRRAFTTMEVKIFSGLLVDSEPDWSLRVEEGVLVVLGDRIVERAGKQDLQTLADRLYFD